MMPTMFGQPFYPGGFPIPKQNITWVNGKTIEEICLCYWERKHTQEEEEILKEYVVYYINAPLFQMDDDSKKVLERISLDNLLDQLMEMGIDPL